MLLKLVMPYVDRLIQAGSIVKWHKAEGEWVDCGDDLFDMAAAVRGVTGVQITASDSGMLRRIYLREGAHLDVGGLVAVLTTQAGESIDEGEQMATVGIFRVVVNFL